MTEHIFYLPATVESKTNIQRVVKSFPCFIPKMVHKITDDTICFKIVCNDKDYPYICRMLRVFR